MYLGAELLIRVRIGLQVVGCAILVQTLCGTAQAQTPPNDPISYWPLASNAVNAVQGKADGRIVGGGEFKDNALSLNGGFITFGNDPSLTVASNLSFCAWIKPSDESRIMRLLGKFQLDPPNNREYCMFLGADSRIWIFISGDGSADQGQAILKATASPAVQRDAWQFLAVTWDAAKGSNGLSLYTNAQPATLLSAQEADIHAMRPGSADLTLGAYDIIPGEAPQTNTFHGSVSCLVIFNTVLSAVDVQAVYDLGRTGVGDGTESLVPAGKDLQSGAGVVQKPDPMADATVYGEASAPDGVAVPGSETDGGTTNVTGRMLIGRVIYVDKQMGDDALTGKGSIVVGQDGPKKTIRAGLAESKPGDSIIIKDGHYSENLNIVGRDVSVRIEGSVNNSGRAQPAPAEATLDTVISNTAAIGP